MASKNWEELSFQNAKALRIWRGAFDGLEAVSRHSMRQC